MNSLQFLKSDDVMKKCIYIHPLVIYRVGEMQTEYTAEKHSLISALVLDSWFAFSLFLKVVKKYIYITRGCL